MKSPPSRIDLLLVDDNRDDCFLMLRQLLRTDPDLEVGVCHDGEEALRVLFDSNRPLPKAVFLDLQLGVMSGHEVLALIRSNDRTRTLPVVILTSGPAPPDILNASYRLGANSCLRKPVSSKRDTIGLAGLYWANRNQLPRGP